MKKFLLLTALCLCLMNVFAQKTSEVFLPAKAADMPTWMNLFYDGITNAHTLEAAFNTYYKTHPFEKNTYTQYYKRYMMENERYIQDDGSIYKPVINAPSLPKSNNHAKNSNSAWSLVGPVETFQPEWFDTAQPSVPWQVNLYAFDVAPSDHNILYACPETGGIFKSIDKGMNWFSVSDTVRLGTMTAIAVDPTDPLTVYASGGNNVYKTTNGGGTWATVYSVANLNCNDIAIFPHNPNVILLAGGGGLFKSINAGLTFAFVGNTTGPIYDIEINALRDSSVYILRKANGDSCARVYRSYDGATTFAVANNGWISGVSSAGRMSITTADTNYIYVVLLMNSLINAPAIIRSTDAGNSWTHTCTGIQNSLQGDGSSPLGMSNGQGYYDLSIMASTVNPNEVIVGSTTAYKSVDTGNTFTRLGGYGGSFPLHPDMQEMKMVGNDAWIATDGGMNYSNDFFTGINNLSARNKGIYGSDYWGYGQGWNEDLMTGGRYHNGDAAMYDGYPSGQSLRLGGGEQGTGYGMVGRDMYIAHSDIGAFIMPKTFSGMKSDFTFNTYPNEDGYGWDASEIEFSPDCYNIMFIGKDSSIWKSIDGGVSYIEIHNFHQRVKKFEICRSNPQVMYLATANKLYKTTDGGANWTILTLPTGCFIGFLSLSVSYTDENTLWVTSRSNTPSNKVFKTIDGGANWINLTTPTISPYYYLTVNHQAGTDGGVYITSNDYAKVFYRNNTMSDWADFSTNLPKEYKPLTTKPFYMKNKLRTAGNRGIWEIDFYEDGLPIAQPTVDKLESACARDTFYFDDFSAVNHALVSWQWSFPGATYVSATNIRNPKVKYNTMGAHTATLTVTQSSHVSTKSVTITVLTNACDADSIPGNALKLTNDGDVATAPALNLYSNTITISAWIKPTDSLDDWSGVVFCRGGTSCSGISLLNSNELRYHWTASFWDHPSGLFVTPNQWNHIALVITPNNATLYLNGVPFVDGGIHSPEAFDASLIIGKDAYSNARTYKGLIDEVCIWNRSLNIDEIRALRHLTKKPVNDTSIVAYYQFNEASGAIMDRAGVRHASLNAGATRVVSTGPFAGGTSSKMNVTSGGNYTFNNTDVMMSFPTIGGSIYPDGDVWVSKLNYTPDQWANPYPMAYRYWVANNYGNNTVFSPLDSLIFSGLPAFAMNNPANYYLYERGENADSATWGSIKDTADIYALNGNNSHLQFSTNNNITSTGQFSLNALTAPNVGIKENKSTTDFTVTSYPNPADNTLFLELITTTESKNSFVTIYNLTGRQIVTSKQNLKAGRNIIMLNTASLAEGVYEVAIEVEGTRKNQRIVVSR